MRDETSPTARALLTLEMVQSRPVTTAEELAERLGVTSRAARRYIAILREAGIPITATSGPAGGYRAGRGVRPAPLVFSEAEALGLVMAVLDGHHDVRADTDPVGSALAKILRVLPEAVAARAEAIRRTTAPAPDPAAARPAPATTAALVRARSECRRARLDYRSEAGAEMVLDVEPWAVVVRHGRWYLVCRSVRADAVRAYRVDRVRTVQVLDETFVPPDDLDPVRVLEEHLAAGWEFATEVLVETPADRLDWLPRVLGRLENAGPGRCRLIGTTSNPVWYAEQLAMLPAPFRVRGGPELRDAVHELGERLLAAAR